MISLGSRGSGGGGVEGRITCGRQAERSERGSEEPSSLDGQGHVSREGAPGGNEGCPMPRAVLATLLEWAPGDGRRWLTSGRGGESWAWGEWHMPLLGFVPILFCFSKNLFQIILGPHCSSGRNRIVKHIQRFPHASPGENHVLILSEAICIHSPTAVEAAARDKPQIGSASVSLARRKWRHVTSEGPGNTEQGPGRWEIPRCQAPGQS